MSDLRMKTRGECKGDGEVAGEGGWVMPTWSDGRERGLETVSLSECVCVHLLRMGMLNRSRACCTQLGLTGLPLFRSCKKEYMYMYVCICVCVCGYTYICMGIAIGRCIYTPICVCSSIDIDTQTYMYIACSYGREEETAASHSPLLPASLQTLSGSF